MKTLHRFITALLSLLPVGGLAAAVEAVSPQALQALLATEADQTVILDVRSQQEYAQGHVPTAINIPHNAILENPDLLEPYQGRKLVVYCRSGRRAGRVTDLLKSSDTDWTLYHLQGDFLGWQAEGLPVESH